MKRKKRHIFLFVIIIVGLMFGVFQIVEPYITGEGAGDDTKNISSVDGIRFDSLVVDTTAQLSGAQPNARVRIHLSIMYAKNNDQINKAIAGCGIFFPENINTDSISLQEVCQLFVKQYVEEFKKDYKDVYFVEQGATNMDISYVVSTKIEDVTDKTFAYIATTLQSAGGPYPARVVYARNIDIQTGRPLELDDVFVAGYHHKLTDKIVASLEKQYQVSTYEELQEKGIFAGIDPYPSKNFILSNDAITFIYNQDEIAQHDVGEMRVKLAKKELAGIIK